MTRFARADGSKASNKRTCEEASSWQDIKADLKETEKKLKIKKVNNNKKKVKGNLSAGDDKSSSEKHLAAVLVKKTNPKTIKKVHTSQSLETKQKSKKRKSSYSEETTENNESLKTKKKKEKKMSLEERKNDFIVEDGRKYKVFKNGVKRPWLNLIYGENDDMTRYKNYFVKREAVAKLEEYKRSLEEENLSATKITNQMLNMERKVHNQLRLELMRKQIKQRKEDKNSTSNMFQQKMLKPTMKKKSDFKYEENDLMTRFDDHWILKKNFNHMHVVYDIKMERIIQQRTSGNTDPKLTSDEKSTHRRLMKKEKRREHSKLNKRLKEMSMNKRPLFNKGCNTTSGIRKQDTGSDIVKYDVSVVKKEGAERLNKLRKQMVNNACTKEEIRNVMKTERRQEERKLKREKIVSCFRCRGTGHLVSMCPENIKDGNVNGVEICFKCGSAEHMFRDCPNKSKGSLPYASCFICGEVGHISKECPDNPRGLYPNEGCCNECGSVEHLKKDCPDLQKQFTDSTMKLARFRRGQDIESLDYDSPQMDGEYQMGQKQTQKTVIFDD